MDRVNNGVPYIKVGFIICFIICDVLCLVCECNKLYLLKFYFNFTLLLTLTYRPNIKG